MTAIFGVFGSYNERDPDNLSRHCNHRAPSATLALYKASAGFIGTWSQNPASLIFIGNPERPEGIAVYDGFVQLTDPRSGNLAEEITKWLNASGPEYTNICGLYSMIVWDIRRSKLWLARDPSGSRPLYFTRLLNNSVVFSSSLKSLFSVHSCSRELNESALKHYLSMVAVPDPETIYKNVYAVQAGCSMSLTATDTREVRFWRMPWISSESIVPEESELALSLRKALNESVVSAIPGNLESTGFFLSGGSDTTTVVGIAATQGLSPIHTFTIGYEGSGGGYDDYNEFHFAKLVADRYRTIHHEMKISPDRVLTSLPKILTAMEQPSGDAINSFLVAGTLPSEFDYILTGTGGDEIFAGSQWFIRHMILSERYQKWAKLPSLLRLLSLKAGQYLLPIAIGRKIKSLDALKTGVTGIYRHIKLVFKADELAKLLLSGPSPVKICDECSDVIDRHFQLHSATDELNQMIGLLYNHEIINVQVRDLDLMCHAHGMEARSPLIDQRVLDVLASAPGNLKLKNGQFRSLMYAALPDIIPDSTKTRKKMSFIVPMDLWSRRELKPVIDFALSVDTVKRRGIFNSDITRQHYDDYYQRDKERHPFKIWLLALFELWCRFHLDQPVGATPPERIEDIF